ncbi:acetate--CoA ligase family protein [Effusibacillus dendaii]|uniref:CoA-binding domain-containing protein n=1 Tax=Effusibacillus dendaii TaxID=2743772 RepID=A0A7I8D658_9BACL|nr:CoA-binding protein [Effusibacillus dendaii]BCJ85614.1 hypothetical protein skT53_05990 [Effusibacillus dendaii]
MENTRNQVHKLLYPESIAIVGASNNAAKMGGRLLSYLLNHSYKGTVYPVNPKEDIIQGLTAYSSVREVPEKVDLAFLIVPNQHIFSVLQECAEKGIETVIISSSGFSETGKDGERLQKQLIDFAREKGIRLCGPNSIGVVNTHHQLFLSFSMSMEMENVPVGAISFITQSGAVGGGLLSKAWEEGIGIGFCISSGNEADLDSSDYLDYLLNDENTKVICLFLEGISNGEKFKQVLARARDIGKPVIVYKNGRTDIGQNTVKSHTGSLAGNYQVYQALFNQYGIISVLYLEDMFDTAKAMSVLPPPKGNRVGIISTSGGACTILADHCVACGLNLPDLNVTSKEKLKQVLPSFAQVKNPLDTTANIIMNPDIFKETLLVFLDDHNIDSIILMLTTVGEPIASQVAADIIEIFQRAEKPIILAWSIAESLAKQGMMMLKQAQIPLYPTAERAVRVLHQMVQFSVKESNF